MANRFEIESRGHWTFQLVLLGSRLQLEGYYEWADGCGEPLRCSAWMTPQDAPHDVAHALIAHPRCCL